MKRLTSLEEYIKYDGNLTSKNNISIYKWFTKDNIFGANVALNNDVFQLGWKSIAVIEHIKPCNRFKVLEIYKRKDGSFSKAPTNTNNTINNSYIQIVTRAVATCTFVHISIGDSKHIVAHLDRSDLNGGLNIINDELEQLKKKNENQKIIGFCSHKYGINENKFALKIRNLCNSAFCNQYRHTGTDFPLETDEDKVKQFINKNLLGHMEIGLAIEDNSVCLFGDISDISKPPENEDDGISVPTKLFSSLDEFIAKMEEYRNQNGATK